MVQPTRFRLSHLTRRGRPHLAVRACTQHSFLGLHLGHINACPPSGPARVKSMISWANQGFPSDHKTLPVDVTWSKRPPTLYASHKTVLPLAPWRPLESLAVYPPRFVCRYPAPPSTPPSA